MLQLVFYDGYEYLTAPPTKTLGNFASLRVSDRVGEGVASPVLSHHRAYGSVPRRFLSSTIGLSFVPLNPPACVL